MASPGSPHHVLITGASSGIGAALALHYANQGAALSLFARNASRLDGIAVACRKAGGETTTEIGDVGDDAVMARWVEACDARQRVDLVIANAGMGGERALAGAAGESLKDANDMLRTNVAGVANTIIPLLPHFVARRRGQIAIVSSLAAYVALPDTPVYCASKAAVRVYGQALRRLLAPNGVQVSVVCPGFVATPMSASLGKQLPFLWSAERAAHHIADGLSRGRREISFPWQLAALAKLAGCLPSFLVDSLLHQSRLGARS
jgi:short-subunit dehydrogenase